MSKKTIRETFHRLWAKSLRQRYQNLKGRDLEAAEDVAWRAYLSASRSAKAPRKPVGAAIPERLWFELDHELERLEAVTERLRARREEDFKNGLVDADGHPSSLAVRQMLMGVWRKVMRPPENAGPC